MRRNRRKGELEEEEGGERAGWNKGGVQALRPYKHRCGTKPHW